MNRRGYGLRKRSGIFDLLAVLIPKLGESDDGTVHMDDVVRDLPDRRDGHYVRKTLNMHFADTFSFRKHRISIRREWGTVDDLRQSAKSLRDEQVNPRSKERR